MTGKGLKVLSLVLGGAAILVSLAKDNVGEKLLDETITKKVAEAVTKGAGS